MHNWHQIKNHRHEAHEFKRRVIKATIAVIAIIGLLIARLFYLQVIQYKMYVGLAEHNQLELLPIEPNRGLIYDRNGVLLAENTPVFSLNVIPDYVPNINATLQQLQNIIAISPDSLQQFRRALTQHRRYEHIPLKLKLTQDEVATFYVNQYRFPGVMVEAQMIRHYLTGESAVSALGYVGRINTQDLKNIDANNYSASNFVGKVGIEKSYETTLHGKTGYRVTEVDATGHIVRTLKNIQPIPGDTLQLTIDSKLQQVAYDAFGEERGAVVALDPNSGEILALVSHPGYDPNLFANGIDVDSFTGLRTSDDKPMYNRAIRGIFPFASNIKPFLALQALDTGTITPDYTISDPGWFQLPNSNYRYRDWAHGGHGRVDVTKAIMVSCDTFFYTISQKLGIEKMDDILLRFGFGAKTSIDLNEEISGVVASPKWKMSHLGERWYLGNTVISSIGQGYMSTTPLQLADGVAAIAMHGKRFQPHLLLAIHKADGEIVKQPPITLTPVTLHNHDNWDIVINAMKKVVMDPMGTARSRFGANPSYTVAGKTGGAQLYHHKIVNENPTPQSEDSIPKHLRNHNLFIAFAPVENPKIAIAVVSENSIIAPIIARKVMDYYLTAGTTTPQKNDDT